MFNFSKTKLIIKVIRIVFSKEIFSIINDNAGQEAFESIN